MCGGTSFGPMNLTGLAAPLFSTMDFLALVTFFGSWYLLGLNLLKKSGYSI